MSNGATVDRPVPHGKAWSLEDRKQMMREVIARLAKESLLFRLNPRAAADTYGVLTAEVEAEIMKYPQEDCGK